MLMAINPIAWQWGALRVHWYGVIIASAMLLAVYLSVREGKKFGLSPDVFYDLLLWGLPVALVCARAYYVVFQWSYYSQNPQMIYRIWDGGIAIYGGLIGAFIVVLLIARRYWLNAWQLLDIMAPTVILAQGIGRWGNFINQEAHGGVVSRAFLTNLHLPAVIINQMYINGHYYQPTFLYESVWDICGFIVLMVLRRKAHVFKRGEVFLSYLLWYGCGRFIIEGLRTDSLMLYGLRVSQWLSVILVITALALGWWRRTRTSQPWYLDETK